MKVINKEVMILVAEDDRLHASLICKNLRKVGIENPIIEFEDGQKVLDFLFSKKEEFSTEKDKSYLLLLDLLMPRVAGVEVLRRIKADDQLSHMPVIIITETESSDEMEKCRQLGCSVFIKKPIVYDSFVETIKKLGLQLMIVHVPVINPGPIRTDSPETSPHMPSPGEEDTKIEKT
ncbi:MAG: response regulator [bacterium]|nr:response regulator [bacterium]